MPKIILQGYIIVSDADLDIVKNELKIHKNLTQKETGCLVFNVTQDTTNVNIFHVYEEFTNKQAFDSHQSRVKNSNWGKVTANVQRHYKISK